MSNIDFNELKNCISYDPNTGLFIWTKKVNQKIPAGTIAGTPNTNGHIQIRFKGKRVFAHRLAWMFVYGSFPAGMIDHINRIRDDNRICNLRDVTATENAHNRKGLGVTFVKSRGKWQAGIGVSGHFKFLGYFDSSEEANKTYIKAKRIYHPSAPVN